MEIKLINGGLAADDRGYVRFINDFNFLDVKRFYHVTNHEQGFIRAWHGHKNESKYVYISRGTALIGIVNLDTEEIKKITLTDKKPSILYIPKNCANGFMTLEKDTDLLFFSSSTLEESLNDDIRYPYDKWNIWNKDYR